MRIYCNLIIAFITLWCISIACSSEPLPEPDNITCNTSQLDLGYEYGTRHISITANNNWTATSSAGWCSLSQQNGKAGTSTITITYTSNSDEERTAVITFNCGTAKATVIVTQIAQDMIRLSQSSNFEISPDNTQIQISLTSNVEWTAASDQIWCKPSVVSGGKGKHTITLNIDANSEITDRTAIVSFKGGDAQTNIKISQFRKEFIVLEKLTYEIDYKGGETTIELNSNTDISATANESWVTIKSIYSDKIVLSTTKNVMKKERMATLELAGKYITTSLNIIQKFETIGGSGVEGMPNEEWD